MNHQTLMRDLSARLCCKQCSFASLKDSSELPPQKNYCPQSKVAITLGTRGFKNYVKRRYTQPKGIGIENTLGTFDRDQQGI